MARRGAIHPRWEWSRWEASNIDVGPEGERTGVSESIEARERNSQALRHTSYPRRESNPHLRFRKPLFYPLNYGDDDSGKNRLIEWRWATCCSSPQRFGEGRLCLDSPREAEI